MQEEEDIIDPDISISFSPQPPRQLPGSNFTWVTFNLEKSKEVCYAQAYVPAEAVEKVTFASKVNMLKLPQRNGLHQIADDIMQRCLKYGKLDSTQKIAKKTGASRREEVAEKDNNFYDQDDSFIDDSEQGEHQGPRMALPEVGLSDFACIPGDIKVLKNSKPYKEKLLVLKSFEVLDHVPDAPKPPQATKNSDKKQPQKKVKPNPSSSNPKTIANTLPTQSIMDIHKLLSSLSEGVITNEKKKTKEKGKEKEKETEKKKDKEKDKEKGAKTPQKKIKKQKLKSPHETQKHKEETKFGIKPEQKGPVFSTQSPVKGQRSSFQMVSTTLLAPQTSNEIPQQQFDKTPMQSELLNILARLQEFPVQGLNATKVGTEGPIQIDDDERNSQ